MQVDTLQVVADRGYFNSPEILACHEAGITVTLPKPMTSGAKSEGRFGKQDFVYVNDDGIYRCPAGERLTYRYTNEEDGKRLRRYWTTGLSVLQYLEQRIAKGSRARTHGNTTRRFGRSAASRSPRRRASEAAAPLSKSYAGLRPASIRECARDFFGLICINGRSDTRQRRTRDSDARSNSHIARTSAPCSQAARVRLPGPA
jgi:hypothetical protein